MASVQYEYDCVKGAGFMMDPNQHKRVGYVTSLSGFGQAKFSADLTVAVPFNSGAKPTFSGIQFVPGGSSSLATASVVGVIEKFSWNGGVGDAIKIDFWVSQKNALQIKTMQQSALKTTSISALAWWIVNYDQERKVWYEQSYPLAGSVAGVVAGGSNPSLNVDLTPAPVADGIDVYVYKVSLSVAPGANGSYTLHFANSVGAKQIKSWGLVVGTLAQGALLPAV
jgi:hypothetical protein